MKQVMLSAAAVLALTACAPTPLPPELVYRPYHYEVLAGNFGWPPAPQPYCYRTLGEPDCRVAPLIGEQARLINDPAGVNPYSRYLTEEGTFRKRTYAPSLPALLSR